MGAHCSQRTVPLPPRPLPPQQHYTLSHPNPMASTSAWRQHLLKSRLRKVHLSPEGKRNGAGAAAAPSATGPSQSSDKGAKSAFQILHADTLSIRPPIRKLLRPTLPDTPLLRTHESPLPKDPTAPRPARAATQTVSLMGINAKNDEELARIKAAPEAHGMLTLRARAGKVVEYDGTKAATAGMGRGGDRGPGGPMNRGGLPRGSVDNDDGGASGRTRYDGPGGMGGYGGVGARGGSAVSSVGSSAGGAVARGAGNTSTYSVSGADADADAGCVVGVARRPPVCPGASVSVADGRRDAAILSRFGFTPPGSAQSTAGVPNGSLGDDTLSMQWGQGDSLQLRKGGHSRESHMGSREGASSSHLSADGMSHDGMSRNGSLYDDPTLDGIDALDGLDGLGESSGMVNYTAPSRPGTGPVTFDETTSTIASPIPMASPGGFANLSASSSMSAVSAASQASAHRRLSVHTPANLWSQGPAPALNSRHLVRLCAALRKPNQRFRALEDVIYLSQNTSNRILLIDSGIPGELCTSVVKMAPLAAHRKLCRRLMSALACLAAYQPHRLALLKQPGVVECIVRLAMTPFYPTTPPPDLDVRPPTPPESPRGPELEAYATIEYGKVRAAAPPTTTGRRSGNSFEEKGCGDTHNAAPALMLPRWRRRATGGGIESSFGGSYGGSYGGLGGFSMRARTLSSRDGTNEVVSAEKVQIQAVALLGLLAQSPPDRPRVQATDERHVLSKRGGTECLLVLARLDVVELIDRAHRGTDPDVEVKSRDTSTAEMGIIRGAALEALHQWPVPELSQFIVDRRRYAIPVKVGTCAKHAWI